MEEKFEKYVSTFDTKDGNIKAKYDHSIRVEKLCEKIAEHEGFSEDEVELSKVIGLLHDYARFPQWQQYGTFIDEKSVDHGELAVKLLFENGEIEKYWQNNSDYDVIRDAILYHNKYLVPDNLPDRNRKFCKLVRDADKLDILYILVSNIYKLNEEGTLSSRVIEDFYNHKTINTMDKRSGADGVLRTLAFAYDLNFEYSFIYLQNNKYFSKLFTNIEDKNKFKLYFDEVDRYVENKISKT